MYARFTPVTRIALAAATLLSATAGTVSAAADPVCRPPTDMPVADVYKHVAPSVVQVVVDQGEGSGVRIGAGILTNAHVVQGTHHIRVFTMDMRSADATVVRIDARKDLALLQADLSLPAIQLDSPQNQCIGNQVLVLGFPLGIRDGGGKPLLSAGILSGIVTSNEGTLVQTDAAINHGNSGGAIVNLRGDLIAVPALMQRGNDAQGVNFGIGADTVDDFLTKPAATSTIGYQGAARDIAVDATDLGSEWILTGEREEQNGDVYRAYFATRPEAPNQLTMNVVVFVAPTTDIADQAIRQLARAHSPRASRVNMPVPGDAAYSATSDSSLWITVQKDNVVLIVSESGQSELNQDTALGVLGTMVDRVRQT